MKWTTITKYVDLETGEALTKYKTEVMGYKIINKTKLIYYDNISDKKVVEITYHCKKEPYRPQEFNFGPTEGK